MYLKYIIKIKDNNPIINQGDVKMLKITKFQEHDKVLIYTVLKRFLEEED